MSNVDAKHPLDPSRIVETFTIRAGKNDAKYQVAESEGSTRKYLLPRIEAIHAGTTRNYNHYLAEKLKGDPIKKTGVYSWMNPYPKPVIYNHDTHTEATGRIQNAIYTDYTEAGKPGIILIPKITDPKAIEALEDGRLLTVSVGATTDSVICSITGKDILKDGYTGYEKGEYYDGKLCEWILGDLWFDELSWVNVPADQEAMVRDTQTSIFLEPTESVNDNPEQQLALMREAFGVLPGMSIVVPELESTKNPQRQEENTPMEDKDLILAESENAETELPETPEVVDAPNDEATPETQGEPEELDKPEDLDAPEVLDALDEPDSLDPLDPLETLEEPNDSAEEAVKENALMLEARVEIAGLKAQVEALSTELKDTYIDRIMEKTSVTKEKADSYKTRLATRTLESLRDKLVDLEEEADLLSLGETAPAPVESSTRQTKAVKSPVPEVTESDQSEKFTDKDYVNFMASMLRQKR